MYTAKREDGGAKVHPPTPRSPCHTVVRVARGPPREEDRMPCERHKQTNWVWCSQAHTLLVGVDCLVVVNRKQLMHADLENPPRKGQTNLAQVQACPVFLPRSACRCERYHNNYHFYKLQGLCFSLVIGEGETLSRDDIFPIYHESHPIITYRLVTLQWPPSCIRI